MLFFSFLGFAQTITQTIRGSVLDKQTQMALPGAVVQILNTDPLLGAITNEEGSFKITDVPLGRWQIKVSAISFKEKYLTVVLNSAKEAVLAIELEESLILGEEIVISSQQDKTGTNNKMSTVSSRLFSAEEAARYAGTRNDPARMAANYAGVSGANDSRNDIIIRGNSPIGLLWRVNGLDISNPNHFGNTGSTGGPVSILNNNVLDNSDFMTGAFAADYGNATAGVFDLRMRKGNNEKYEFLAQMGFNGLEFGAEGPLNKNKTASFLLGYRYSTLSIFKALNIDFGTGAAVPQYQDLTFKADFNAGKWGRWSLWGIGGLSYIALLDRDKKPGQDLYGFSARDTYFRANQASGGLSNTLLLPGNAFLQTNLGISSSLNMVLADRIDSAFQTPGNIMPEYRQSNAIVHYLFNSTYHKRFNARNFINAGIYSDYFTSAFVDSSVQDFATNNFITLRNYRGSTTFLRAFAQWQHKFTDQLTMILGLNNQYLALNKSYALEPRVGMRYVINTKQSVSAGAGLHSQMQPAYIYFASETINNVRVETNRGLDFTRAAHAVLAHDCNYSGNFRTKTEIYYQHIYSAPVKNTPNNFSALNLGTNFDSPNLNNLVSKGRGYNYGLELTLEKFYSRGYYFLATTSLFQSKYKGSDGVERNTAFNGNYVFNFLAGKEFKIKERHTLILDIRSTYAGGKRYTPIDLEASILANAEVLEGNRAFELQYPDYFRTDIKPGYRMNSKKLTHEFSIDIQNISRHDNVFQQTYDIKNKTIKTDYQLKFFVIPQYRLLF